MTIPASEIVAVNPSVLEAGGNSLSLNGLYMTSSTLPPIGAVPSFATQPDVATYFGAASAQAAAATVYFAGFDGSQIKPGKALFAQYNADDVAAYVRGGTLADTTLAELQAFNASLSVTIDGATKTASINLAAATSFSNAAELIGVALGIHGVENGTFTAAISTTTMTVSAIGTAGDLAAGQVLTGAGVTANTFIVSQLTGTTGGTGTYTVSASQTVGSETITAYQPGVAYNSSQAAFVINSSTTGDASTITYGSGALATDLLLTSATGAVLSQGADGTTPSVAMNAVVAIRTDWVSFTNLEDPDASGNANKLLFAQWNAQQNNRYLYVPFDTDAEPTTTNPGTTSLGYLVTADGYGGTSPAYQLDDTNNLNSFIMGAVASVDYSQTAGRATIAFKSQGGLTPTAANATIASNLIANGYNYYGAYATATEAFTFAYPGSVSGEFKFIDSYVDQIWLNTQCQTALLIMLTNIRSIPYNPAGYSIIETTLLTPINDALNAGVIQPGVVLSGSQIAAINQAAGNQNAARTVQNQGWYLKIGAASASVRAARGSPPCTLWYSDGESVQKITLNSVAVL